mmetsp:Transcript_26908/g.30255  ORF Transcript_26908/g.30255 Transcript_26908/m.30255 type:complete len:82 (-) Transcript_26908:1041-1286(-)
MYTPNLDEKKRENHQTESPKKKKKDFCVSNYYSYNSDVVSVETAPCSCHNFCKDRTAKFAWSWTPNGSTCSSKANEGWCKP